MSDHCPVRAILNVKVLCTNNYSNEYEFIDKPQKVCWNKDISYKFENILQSPDFTDKFDRFVATEITGSQSSIDKATVDLSDYLMASLYSIAFIMQAW